MPLGGGTLGSAHHHHHHHGMYEDPDAHLGHHRPLVMHRHHQLPHHHHHHYQQHHAEVSICKISNILYPFLWIPTLELTNITTFAVKTLHSHCLAFRFLFLFLVCFWSCHMQLDCKTTLHFLRIQAYQGYPFLHIIHLCLLPFMPIVCLNSHLNLTWRISDGDGIHIHKGVCVFVGSILRVVYPRPAGLIPAPFVCLNILRLWRLEGCFFFILTQNVFSLWGSPRIYFIFSYFMFELCAFVGTKSPNTPFPGRRVCLFYCLINSSFREAFDGLKYELAWRLQNVRFTLNWAYIFVSAPAFQLVATCPI